MFFGGGWHGVWISVRAGRAQSLPCLLLAPPEVIWTNVTELVVTSVLTNMGDNVGFCPKQLRATRDQNKHLSVALNQRLDPGLGPEEKSSLLNSLMYVIFLACAGSAGALWGAEPWLQPLPAHQSGRRSTGCLEATGFPCTGPHKT